jgi:hypothetical protein
LEVIGEVLEVTSEVSKVIGEVFECSSMAIEFTDEHRGTSREAPQSAAGRGPAARGTDRLDAPTAITPFWTVPCELRRRPLVEN